MFWVALHNLWDLSSSTRATTWNCQVLTTGLAGDCLPWEVPPTSILKGHLVAIVRTDCKGLEHKQRDEFRGLCNNPGRR